MLKFQAGNACLHYKITGQGHHTLLFLHGFLEDHSIWNTVYPHFVNAGFRCALIDLPCHGLSRFDREICTMQQMAMLLSAFLDDQEIKEVRVIGHSMGGYVGLELLRLQPVHRLILLHSHFWEDSTEKKKDRNRVIEIVKTNKSLFLSEAIPALFAPANRQRCASAIGELIEKAAKIPVGEIAAATAGMRDRRASHDIAGNGGVFCIQGSDDPVVPRIVFEKEASQLKIRPPVTWLENSGHMSIWEQHHALINGLEAFVIG